MKIGLILLLLFLSTVSQAFCPIAVRNTIDRSSLLVLKSCAEGMNDDASQVRLATLYEKGSAATPKNIQKTLYYYQLSADNGNADSQAKLAQLYMNLDKDRAGRADLQAYMNTVVPSALPGYEDDFKGELIHPYVLLMLANEKPENKWYYPTEVKKAPAFAANLFRNYKIDDQKKKQLMRQATAWKKRKLLEIAKQILSAEEYRSFEETMYPANGQADAFKRSQLLKSFQEKVLLKQKQDQESAKAFY